MKRFIGLFTGVAGALGCLAAMATPGSAADYPTRQVHIIVGYPAGGSTDIVARLIGNWLSSRLGQQFIVENRPGAGNNIATEAVTKTAPDGYTMLLVNPANTINASLYKNLNFNFLKDIDPVASVIEVPNVMEVNSSCAGQDGGGIHRLCQGEPRQDQRRVVRQWHVDSPVRRIIQDDDRTEVDACALQRFCADADRSSRRPRCRSRSTICRRRSPTSKPGSCARLAFPPRSVRRNCRTCRPSRKRCRATRPAPSSDLACHAVRRRKSSIS